ncbi:MAG: FAD-dependent oxidoreductase [Planctomycetota bacterium]|jgi:flavin-dependent dehydrogenase|nr:FAD-dependent oxidoreductase [Planctomycetota bacterium]
MIDALVVGGGLAGAAVATHLAAAGRKVVVFERRHVPHDKVCGEFLSHEACTYLDTLGINLGSLGAVPISAVRIANRNTVTTMALPFPALSLSRGRLDEALLQRATAAGATVHHNTQVQTLTRTNSGCQVRLADDRVISAQTGFLATGKHDLRGWKRPAGLQNDLLAFKLHFQLDTSQAKALKGHVELGLFTGGYAGLSPIEGGRANLCLLVRRKRFTKIGHTWDNLLAAIREESPHLNERLNGATACSDRPLALARIPYGYIRRRAHGLFHLGDQAAVIPSFSGDGMSIALHSAALAAKYHLAGRDPNHFQRQLARDLKAQVLFATYLSQGLVRHPLQRLLTGLIRIAPTLITTTAARTRVPNWALARARKRGASLACGVKKVRSPSVSSCPGPLAV